MSRSGKDGTLGRSPRLLAIPTEGCSCELPVVYVPSNSGMGVFTMKRVSRQSKEPFICPLGLLFLIRIIPTMFKALIWGFSICYLI